MKSEKAKMVEALQDMMQGFGIPSIEIADDDGKVHCKIDAPPVSDKPCKVPMYGGGMVSIRKGDHIQLWCRPDYGGSWKKDSAGIVLCVRPDKHYRGQFDLAYQRDNSDKTEGPSSCILRDAGFGWARTVEKI